MKAGFRIVLSEEERATLEHWVRGRVTEVRLVQRARIVLEAAQGRTNRAIAEKVGLGRRAVGRWRLRRPISLSGIYQLTDQRSKGDWGCCTERKDEGGNGRWVWMAMRGNELTVIAGMAALLTL